MTLGMPSNSSINENALLEDSGSVRFFAVLLTVFCLLLASGVIGKGAIVVAICLAVGFAMVVSQRIEFFPALLFLFSTGNSASLLLPIVMAFICVIRYNEFREDKKMRALFLLLVLVFPLFAILVYQRHSYDFNNWSQALSYAQYYLSFWLFLFYYAIGKSINQFTLRLLFGSLLAHVALATFFHLDIDSVGGRLYIFALSVLGAFSIVGFFNRNKVLYIIILFFAILLLGGRGMMTFTTLGSFALTLVLVYCSMRNNRRWLIILGQYPIFIFWFALILYGVNNYYYTSFSNNSEGVSFSSWISFKQYLDFKIFSDRAPYWDGAITQLFQIRPFLPVHDIPDISFETFERSGEVDFGGHNTYLQLLRVFGFVMGGILIFCYVKMTTLATKGLMSIRHPLFMAIIATAIAFSIVFCLTGTASMLTNLGGATFGIMGLAYRQVTD